MNPDEMPPVPPVPTSAPVSTPPTAAPAPEVVAPAAPSRAGHGKAIAAIATIGVLALLGAGYAWAYRGAAAVLPAAAEKLSAAASFRSSVSMEISAEADGESFAGSIQFEGDVDQSDPESPKTQLTVDGEIDGLLASAEMRLIDGNLYFQATKIPGAGLAGDPSLDAMVNQWFFVSLEELEALTGETASPEAADDAEESLGRLIDAGAVSFGSPRVAKFDGEYAREYAVSVDSDKLADFAIEEMRRLATTTESRETVDEIEPVVRAVLKAVSVSDAKVRVALFSGELRSVEGAFVIDISKVDYEAIAEAAGEVADPEDMQGKVTLRVSATYDGYGEPVSVEAPVGATSLMGLLGGMPTDDADLYYEEYEAY